jgi:hypothetical protein
LSLALFTFLAAPQSVMAQAPAVNPAPNPASNSTDQLPLGNKFLRVVQTATGMNFLASFVASKVTGVVLSKKTGGRVKAKVGTYSLTDLAAGKVKSIKIVVTHPKLNGVELGEFQIKTQKPLWVGTTKRYGLKQPNEMLVYFKFTQEQIQKILADERATAMLKGLKIDLPGLGAQEISVIDPSVVIGQDSLDINVFLVTKGAARDTGVQLAIFGHPKLIEERKIVIDSLKIESPTIDEPLIFADFVSKLVNPIIDFARFDRTDHAFRLSVLTVNPGKIEGMGRLLLVPRSKK